MTAGLTGMTRALACLALEHGDEELTDCPSTDEELAQALIQEVRRLRQRIGEEPDREAQEAALCDALTDDRLEGCPAGLDLAQQLLDGLAAEGWTLASLA